MFSTVQRYRASHQWHHSDLGFDCDPDKVRHEELRLADLNRESFWDFSFGIVSRLLRYIPSWWHAIGTTLFVAGLGIIWHISMIAVISAVFGSLYIGAEYWLFAFVAPFAFIVPILRFVGEAAKHDYTQHDGIAHETFSNTGVIHKVLIHPHGDGFHTLHHLFPHIPHSKLSEVDKMLREEDAVGWMSHLRERKHVLENA
jgi:fatty acid desaturase